MKKLKRSKVERTQSSPFHFSNNEPIPADVIFFLDFGIIFSACNNFGDAIKHNQ